MCSFGGWINHGGAYLQNGGANREGLRDLRSCLGIGGLLLKFERKCRCMEQREKMSRNWLEEKIHMVAGVGRGFDGLS